MRPLAEALRVPLLGVQPEDRYLWWLAAGAGQLHAYPKAIRVLVFFYQNL